ncbi:hypothetical protein [Cryptosporangium sp. NPDC048952]|uniref:hypothetical protein n=1 Tax=Cryptosporangium sp. NPDC048952 TaxID=3363961 RepID=UPI00371341B0
MTIGLPEVAVGTSAIPIFGRHPYLAGPKTLAEEIVPTITAAAQRAGRPAPPRPTSGSSPAKGLSKAAELAVLGDEKTVEDAIRRYHDAGATDVVVTQTHFGGPADQQRTYELLGSLT